MLRDCWAERRPKPDFLRLGEGVRLSKGVPLGEGELRLGEPEVSFHAVFCFASAKGEAYHGLFVAGSEACFGAIYGLITGCSYATIGLIIENVISCP